MESQANEAEMYDNNIEEHEHAGEKEIKNELDEKQN